MKLWVDDIRNAPDDTWTVARTTGAAIRAMHHWEPSVVSLDHDISHQIVMEDMSRPFRCSDNYKAVAYYIVARQWKKKPKVRLHTSNRVGGSEMKALLEEHGFEVEEAYTGAANRLEMEA